MQLEGGLHVSWRGGREVRHGLAGAAPSPRVAGHAVVSVVAVRHGLEPRTAFWPGSLPLFYRQEQRDLATLVIRGRLSGLERTTAEPNAHQAGRPDRATHGHLQLGGRVPGRNEAARIEAWCHRTKTFPPRRLIAKGAAGAPRKNTVTVELDRSQKGTGMERHQSVERTDRLVFSTGYGLLPQHSALIGPTMTSTTRRDFLKTTALAGTLAAIPSVHAAGSDVLKVGLIGCGDRGTGAASQALAADPNVKLVAMADAFEDRLEKSLSLLQQDEKIASKVDVKPEFRFVGFEAYQKLIDSGVDVVLLCEPPHFRPQHLRAAVEAGKHVFAEKPVAVDAPGVRSVLETCERAQAKGLSIVSGLCLRYDNGFRATVHRLQEGAIGDVTTLLANDYRSGRWAKPKQPDWTEMTYQMRNWYNFTWLSGDFNVEQHVHMLDLCSWVMKNQYPVKAVGMGGRQVLTEPEYGQIYDHISVVYTYADGAVLIGHCRQQPGCKNDISARVLGTKGSAELTERRKGMKIHNASGTWVFDGPKNEMYQTEHDELFASIRAGKPINNGDYMAKSTLLAIMGRMAAYTGQEITWEMALNSQEDLSPVRYAWDAAPPTSRVAMPGQTKFV
jgi:predicted dehydrogenase